MSSSPALLPWSVECRIDQACDEFEAAWRSGAPPRLEDYLLGANGSNRSELLQELLALELQYRLRRGEQPDINEYRHRFPEDRFLVERVSRDVLIFGSGGRETPPLGVFLDGETSRDPDGFGRRPAHAAESDAATLAAGERLGDYRVLEQLGEGGMGVVYRARQTSADRIVALKLIRPDRLEGASREQQRVLVERFRHEAQAAARLEHEHILPVYEVGLIGDRPFYSMRYVPGGSLADALREGPLDSARAARIVEAVSRGVEHAHAHGVLHRDLKPGNVLIDDADRPYVTDFGMVKTLEGDSGLTQTGAALGTPSYMSPEQAQNASAVSAASDVYSLGATLYAALTGRAPFQSPNPVTTLRQVVEGEAVRPRHLNPAVARDLETICLKCLEKPPSRRYASAADLVEDLRRFQAGEPIRAQRSSLARRLLKWSRRRPALAGLTVATTAAVLVLLGVWFKFHGRPAGRQRRSRRRARCSRPAGHARP